MDDDPGPLSSFGEFMLWVGIIGFLGFVFVLMMAGGS